MEEKILGTGIKFPFQVNQATGRFIMSAERESIRESIYLILHTQKSERFARFDYGSRLTSYTFMDVSATWLTVLSGEIREDILSQEPRISNVDIQIEEQTESAECLMIHISYNIITKNTKDNLVFPYYLKEGGAQADDRL